MEALNFNRLAEGSTIEGKVSINGDFYVAGSINGEVILNNNGLLLIEPTGSIEGSIEGKDMQILGKVVGQVLSTGQVTIKSSAHLAGTIRAKAINILPGAIIESTLDIEFS